MSKLVVIDSHAILHRAFHALPGLNFRRDGQMINAVYGYFSMLLRVITDLSPDYLIACFDSRGPNFRHRKFIGYQANRPKMDDELGSQIDLTRNSIKGVNIPVLSKSGFEADDLIGTVVQNKKVDQAIVVTGDKDLMQLVNSRVSLFLLRRGMSNVELVDNKKVNQILEVDPDQVIDLKALMGDSSDNYPGVAGVGPKTAVLLLSQFKTLDGIYENLGKIDKESLKKKLIDGKEAAYLSRFLATIDLKAPVKFALSEATWNQEKLLELKSVVKELGFPSLVRRIESSFDRGKTDQQMSLL
ncbi:MAG: 5'-3' exonuclease H3TH domain-containing protein [Patescibacteria group bacterium]